VTRFLDRGAILAGWVGVGMAAVIVVSFLLVIPIEPVIWLMSPFAGILIGYYANARSDRQAGPWSRILANAAYAGLVTALTLTLLLTGIKALFFVADSGYRDARLGGPISCSQGPDCVYRRYLAEPDGPERMAQAGIADVDDFTRYYWEQQLNTAAVLFAVTFVGGILGGVLYGVLRPRGRARAGVEGPAATSAGVEAPAATSAEGAPPAG
jgi:hypothetical protein